MDRVQFLRDLANGLPVNLKNERGDYGVFEDIADRLDALENLVISGNNLLEPFDRAVSLGLAVREAVEASELQKKGLSKLLGAGIYSGQHAIESNLSWSNWVELFALIQRIEDLIPSEAVQTSS